MAPPQEHNITAMGRRLTRRSLLTGITAVGAVGTLGLTGCSRVSTGDTKKGGDLLERLRAQGFVRVGIAGEPPFGYIDSDGELTGEAPKIAEAVFKRLGIDKIQPVPTEFGSLIPGLANMQFDVVSAGMYITPERCDKVIFSDPTYEMLDAFIVKKGNPKKLHDYQDIVRTGAKLASGTAYAEIDYAIGNGIKRSDITVLPDQLAGLLAVEQGRADAFAGTSVTVRTVLEQTKSKLVESNKPFQPMIGDEPQIGAGGFAFRPNETTLRDAFNRELHQLKRSGELLEIVKPLGFTRTEMTDLTAKELCS
ncbi:ectoine/hydroxyectoine ABC transporter substrate-binding protein EhuB [Streptomyces sp. HNM0574]|uniref:ectoine/hydroxyectoine ABC transporter substrate-binding protein EhuB n=1 Tax=Streptomyces sp. HNM0574 TaxID=2714954 RepID=UPI00146C39C6|nr:ectoine/hydroxyectoine ABC transporter substrate-binding protein EhuB [Streptomyces sp. HNM0574]NLU66499.1 ectoine/hydroxyectoine ABC transporter substrate-binding protein EhuB [Streptomyces sp. HNM0574]